MSTPQPAPDRGAALTPAQRRQLSDVLDALAGSAEAVGRDAFFLARVSNLPPKVPAAFVQECVGYVGDALARHADSLLAHVNEAAGALGIPPGDPEGEAAATA